MTDTAHTARSAYLTGVFISMWVIIFLCLSVLWQLWILVYRLCFGLISTARLTYHNIYASTNTSFSLYNIKIYMSFYYLHNMRLCYIVLSSLVGVRFVLSFMSTWYFLSHWLKGEFDTWLYLKNIRHANQYYLVPMHCNVVYNSSYIRGYKYKSINSLPIYHNI